MALNDRPGRLGAPDLRRVDPGALRAARDLAGRLDGLEIGGATLMARCVPAAGGFWLGADTGAGTGAGGAALSVTTIDGTATALHPERVEAIVAALTALEPALDGIEGATGIALEFGQVLLEPPDAPTVEFRLGRTLFHLVPPSGWHAPDLGEPINLSAAPVPVERVIRGPRIGIEEASGIAAGDLLLLGGGSWPVEARAPPGRWSGLFDPATGSMLIGQPGGTAAGDASLNDSPEPAAFAVPVAVSLPPASATLGELAALAPGSTLSLGPVAAGMEVELRIADRALATGELVRLGDSYAVLVTAVPNSRDVPPRAVPSASAAPPEPQED